MLNELLKIEPSLARRTGYTIKLAECSGIQLCRMFTRVFMEGKCERSECIVCKNGSGDNNNTKCRKTNIVYEAKCRTCVREKENGIEIESVGNYVGESSRSLSERSKEHIASLLKGEETSFIVRHWAQHHIALNEPPEIEFRVLKGHKDAMSRAIHEAVRIESNGNMNAKSEWRMNSRYKLKIELRKWEQEKKE